MEKIEEVENILKDILTPYVWLILKDLNNYLEKEKLPFVLIVVGGDALYNFFPYDENLRSHDFDLRLTPILGTENTKNMVFKQHELSSRFMKHFEIELNKYINNINPIILKNLNNIIGGKGELIGFNAFQGIGEKCSSKLLENVNSYDVKCDLYTLQYKIIFNGKEYSDSLIDLFAVKPTQPYYNVHINPYNTNLPKTHIPYIKIEGVNYGSLGYLLEDTIKLTRIHKYKSKRYEMKLEYIIKNLYNPIGHLSCEAMKDFTYFCSEQKYCILDGNKLNKNELIDFAINNYIIPKEMKNYFKNYSLEYLCKYVGKLKEGMDIKTAMDLDE